MNKVLCVKAGGSEGDKDSGSGTHCVFGRGYLEASFSLPRPRILSLGDISSQQRIGTISHSGDQGLCQFAGLHMGSSSPRCSVGTHLLPLSTSFQCPSGSCFQGESPGMLLQTGPVRFFWNPRRWPCLRNHGLYPTTELIVGERRCTQVPLSPTTCLEPSWASPPDSMELTSLGACSVASLLRYQVTLDIGLELPLPPSVHQQRSLLLFT